MKKLKEEKIVAYHASKENISTFDPNKTGREFGVHFGSLESAKHRGAIGGTDYHIKKYELTVKNSLFLDDVFKWDASSVLRNMAIRGYISKKESIDLLSEIDKEATKRAKEKSSSLNSEKFKSLKHLLEKMGYDSIVYDNKGEAGGVAYIVFDVSQIKEI